MTGAEVLAGDGPGGAHEPTDVHVISETAPSARRPRVCLRLPARCVSRSR